MSTLRERLHTVQLRGNTAPKDVMLLNEVQDRLDPDNELVLRKIVQALHPDWTDHQIPVGFDEARRVLEAINDE